MCGEQFAAIEATANFNGSPPRVRGTAVQDGENAVLTRITPACAGNSKHGCLPQLRGRDHPRVCGEQRIINKVLAKITGSPPRVRGTAKYQEI